MFDSNGSVSTRFLNFIQKNSKKIVKSWSKAVVEDETVSAFAEANLTHIEMDVAEILEEFEKWVNVNEHKNLIGKWYAEQGIKFFRMEIPLCEIARALSHLRRTIIDFVAKEYPYEKPFDLHQMNEFVNRTSKFFDLAQYYILRGYTEEMNRLMKESWTLTDDDTNKIFFERSFYKR